jgi:hypothetical protein
VSCFWVVGHTVLYPSVITVTYRHSAVIAVLTLEMVTRVCP